MNPYRARPRKPYTAPELGRAWGFQAGPGLAEAFGSDARQRGVVNAILELEREADRRRPE